MEADSATATLDVLDEADRADGDEPVGEVLDEDSADESGDDEHSWLRKRRTLLVKVGLATVAAAAIAAVVWTTMTILDTRRDTMLRGQAVDTARDYVVAMAEFDYANLDANHDRITTNSTPDFATRYGEMVDALRDIITTSQGRATASADHVAVERIDEHSAVVIAFVDQVATNVTAPEGNTQKYRMVVSLERSGDRWIVNNVETL